MGSIMTSKDNGPFSDKKIAPADELETRLEESSRRPTTSFARKWQVKMRRRFHRRSRKNASD